MGPKSLNCVIDTPSYINDLLGTKFNSRCLKKCENVYTVNISSTNISLSIIIIVLTPSLFLILVNVDGIGDTDGINGDDDTINGDGNSGEDGGGEDVTVWGNIVDGDGDGVGDDGRWITLSHHQMYIRLAVALSQCSGQFSVAISK